MDEIDDLLSQLKAEYGQPEPEKSSPQKTPPPPKPKAQQSSSPLDHLLAEVKDELAQNELPQGSQVSSSSKQSSSSQENKLLQELQLENSFDQPSQFSSSSFKQQPSISTEQVPYPSQVTSLPKNNLLQDLQSEFKEQEKLEAERRQQEQLEKQRLEEQRQQRQKLALTRKATEWLNKLDPKSEEGRWFEEFSYSYDSRLQAAIHYLEALRETGG